jgi:hypothetical protein
MLLLLLLVPLAVAIALTAALSLWGRRISRRAGCPSWVRHVPWAIAVCGALGAAVFDPAFDSTRGLLGGATSGGAPPDVEVLLGRRPGPWHGVRMIAGCPKLVIEVVHFGCLVHRVTFPVAVDTRKLGYKVDVARGVDSLIYQADDGSWYSADVQ